MHLYRLLQPLRCVLIGLVLAPVIPALRIRSDSEINAPYDMIVRDAREIAPDGFVYLDDLPGDRIIPLEIGLRGRDISGLVKQLYEVSTPGSPSYGKYLSKEEAESYAKPTDETVREVNAWLAHYGVESRTISPSGDRLQITLPVSKANKMLQASFSTFRHTATGTESIQALSYSLPSQLENKVASIEPTTSFLNPTRYASDTTCNKDLTPAQAANIRNCSLVISPKCLKTLYNIPSAKVTHKTNVLSVPAFVRQFAKYTDLASFLGEFNPTLTGANFTNQFIEGGQNPQNGLVFYEEATLDIQYAVSLANFAPVVLVSSGSQNPVLVNQYIEVANYYLRQEKPPSVVSISYGDFESDFSRDTAAQLCNLYTQLGTRGVSILVSSGDGGVAGSQSSACPNGKFRPDFPASCPSVTVVGATTGFPTETAAGLSAGGFSNFFDRPKYQVTAVDGYLGKIGSLYKGRFNRPGRAYPDISAQGGFDVAIVKNGEKCISGGTSAATPIVASIITLLNEHRFQQGRPALGFLNPFLYANPRALNDIKSGSNPGCGTTGFPTKAGWDPVTGLGTPSFPALVNV